MLCSVTMMRNQMLSARRRAGSRLHERSAPGLRRASRGRFGAASVLLVACTARAPDRGAAAPPSTPAAHVSERESSPSATPAAAGAPARTPKYPASTVPFSRDSAYLRRAPSSDFWALSPYYVAQQDDVSCSLASLSMLVNAARRRAPLDSEQPMVTQPLLRQRVNSPIWERGLAPNGEGVTLDQLALLATQSLRAFGLAAARVEVTHVPQASEAALARWREALSASEANADDWLFVNFLASAYVGVGDYGHIAPIGAYDAEARRVLVLDPDRVWYEPYWVPDEVALEGMATRDSVTGEPRGYLYVSM
ncbi:MAG TPA: phytochelatin synthase family protein [Polyangiaceae bacterium]|nr:phytochelatin synthase family protein [Polyangiaceae bacterium]